ncbi:MAG: ASCH domain-containing protein [Candidatus Pacearchaeota archaeon]|nr:ASCH domain-containing protein [Candidatus Pacearchaeota archaeon]
MKAWSLKQPWAELVVSGKKKIEIRKWNTYFRGEFFIHASKIPDKDAMKKFGFNDLSHGGIIGRARLVDVKKYENDEDFRRDGNLHLATSEFGSYGFILGNVRRVREIKCNGALNFWDFEDKKGEINVCS